MFHFYQYVAPTWYHHLAPKKNIPYFVDYRKIPDHLKSVISYDTSYSCEYASLMDAAFQAWNRGVMTTNADWILHAQDTISLVDEYHFIRKYFNPFFGAYILMVRLLCFKNPITNTLAYVQSLKKTRTNMYQDAMPIPSWNGISFPLLASNPKVTVIIPTLNRYTYLKDVFRDLEKQDYQNFEVIVVDQTEPLNHSVYEGWKLDLTLIVQKEKALWLARNTAIQQAKGEWILLYDDDSLVDEYWISNHLKCIDYFQCDISSGVSISKVGASVPQAYSHFKWSDQIDTGNVLLPKRIFRTIGLFDRQFEKQRMGDGEFGLRAFLAGFTNVSNPLAKRVHLKVGEGGLRQMGSWDAFRTKSWNSPRPIPSVLYFTRKYFGNKIALYLCFQKIPLSVIPYRYKSSKILSIFAYPMALLMSPLLLFQWAKSWKLASEKLKEGAKITQLD